MVDFLDCAVKEIETGDFQLEAMAEIFYTFRPGFGPTEVEPGEEPTVEISAIVIEDNNRYYDIKDYIKDTALEVLEQDIILDYTEQVM